MPVFLALWRAHAHEHAVVANPPAPWMCGRNNFVQKSLGISCAKPDANQFRHNFEARRNATRSQFTDHFVNDGQRSEIRIPLSLNLRISKTLLPTCSFIH